MIGTKYQRIYVSKFNHKGKKREGVFLFAVREGILIGEAGNVKVKKARMRGNLGRCGRECGENTKRGKDLRV